MKEFGLIGYPLTHSFSKKYFKNKFIKENIDAKYSLFNLKNISEFTNFIKNQPKLKGLNVTIPHKVSIIPFLDKLDPLAKKIQSVNVINFKNGKIIGYNTDYIGFKNTLPKKKIKKAAILGSGGSSKTVQKVMADNGVEYFVVSRNKKKYNYINYEIFNKIISSFDLIINTTPIGTYPKINNTPKIDFKKINLNHFVYDLIYNPKETLFLNKAKKQGASITNGYKMLIIQAEESWKIWEL